MDASATNAALASIRDDMDKLADHLATMMRLHADDPDAVARLSRARKTAKRGAALVRKRRA